MAGLFGPTPEEIQAAKRSERLGTLQAFGNIPLGTLGGGMAGLLAGEAFQQAVGGGDPQLRRASLLKEAQDEVSQLGFQPGSPGFTQAAVDALRKRGLEQEAQEAFLQGMQLEQAGLQTEKLRRDLNPQADVASIQRRAEGLVLAGVPPEVALRMAPNEKLFETVMAGAFKRNDAPAQIQGYNLAVDQGFGGSFLDYQKALKQAGASNVSVSVGGKPLSTSDLERLRLPDGSPLPIGTTIDQAAEAGATVIPPEEQAAATARAKNKVEQDIAREKAAPKLKIFADALTKIQANPRSLGTYSQARNEAVQAIAEIRNPGKITDDDIKIAAEALPSIADLATGQLDAKLDVMEKVYGISLRQHLGGPKLSGSSNPIVNKWLERARGQ